MFASVSEVGCQPIVQGWPCGSAHLLELDATKSCGTFLSFMYFQMAEFDAAPTDWKIKNTWSCSTSRRVCSTALGGLKLSSWEMKLIWRPLMPPSSLTFL